MTDRSSSPGRLDIVLQPTSGCNLNCSYCYLPGRSVHDRMPVAVADALANAIPLLQREVQVIWHAGEPLSVGVDYLTNLFDVFESLRARSVVTHAIQTNGTLIDRRWCDFFRRYDVNVGISVDGPAPLNKNRVNWAGRPTFDQTVAGIGQLKQAGIRFSVLAVVTQEALPAAAELYAFLLETGCDAAGINIVEQEGACVAHSPDGDLVSEFWAALFRAWQQQPSIRIREFGDVLSWMSVVAEQGGDATPATALLPTILANGDVVLLSPEFAGMQHAGYGTFVRGNVLVENFAQMLGRAASVDYVMDFAAGVEMCRQECEYFSFCQGGHASNKLFERGRLDVTETAYCRNAKIRLVDAVLASM